jgi:DNA-binding transcriptional LysR family regulator
MINPEWLRYFVVVAETRNLRLAAERLHVTHQAISHALAKLEAHLGQTLLDRGQRIRGLTPAGEVFLGQVRGLMDGFEALERRMDELRSEVPRGPVRMAGGGMVHNYLLPAVLVDLARRFPEVRPSLFSMGAQDVERWLAAGELDIGLLPAPPTRGELAFAESLSCRSVIVGPPGPKRPWDELPWIVPRTFDNTGGSVDGWPEDRFPRRGVAEVDQLEAALGLCEAGLGAAFVPDLAVKNRLARGALAVVADTPFELTERFYVAWRRGARLTPAVREAVKALSAR